MTKVANGTDKAEVTRPKDKWEWQRMFSQSDLTPTQRLVLHVLEMRMDPDGSRCYPPVEDTFDEESGKWKPGLITLTGLSRSGLFKALRELRNKGWIAVRSGRRGTASVYEMRVPAGYENSPRVHHVDPKVHHVDPDSAPRGPHQTMYQTNDQTTSPEPPAPAGEEVAREDLEASLWTWLEVSSWLTVWSHTNPTVEQTAEVMPRIMGLVSRYGFADVHDLVSLNTETAKDWSVLRWRVGRYETNPDDPVLQERVWRGLGRWPHVADGDTEGPALAEMGGQPW